MDPRHPEVALTRIDQLVNQFKLIIDEINTETVSSRLGQLEREGGLVVQEICLVAPRLHEAMMQASRNRRHDLSHGLIEETEKNVEEFKKYVATAEIIDDEEPEEKPKKKRKYTKKKVEE